MERLVARIQQLRLEASLEADPHLWLCHKIADEFDLWTPQADGESFPIWLSCIVEHDT